MTKLLVETLRKIQELPEPEQDEAAAFLLMLAAKRGKPVRLDEETRAAVREGLRQARRGEFASDEQIAALFRTSKTS
jgi:predicted transcriptional regulator